MPGGIGNISGMQKTPGEYTIMSRAVDASGKMQPETAHWNALGYGNNGIREHAVRIHIIP